MGRTDFTLRIRTEADLADLQAATREINATSAAAQKATRDAQIAANLRQQISRLERQERAEAFARLAPEQQLNQLLAQRAEIKRRAEQPGIQRSEKVQLAFDLAGKSLDSQIAAAHQRVGTIGLRDEQARRQNLAGAAKESANAILAKDAQAAAAAQAKQEAVDQKLAGRSRELFQLARQQRDAAFQQLSPKQQLLALEEKRERLSRMLAAAGDNELRRSALLVSQRQTEARIGALQAGRQTLGQRIGGSLAGGAAMLGVPLTVGAVAGLAYYKARAEAQQIMAEAEATMDRASRLGVTASRAQEFSFAGRKTALEEAEMGNILKQLQLAQEKASGGDKGTAGAFKHFGITAKDLANLAPDQIFERMARNAAGANRATSSMKDAVTLMGRSADKAVGAFRQGFGAAIDEIRAAGGIMDDEVVARLDEAAKRSQLLGVQLKVAFSEFLPDFIAGLQTAFDWAARIANRMSLSGKALSVLAMELDYKILKGVAGNNAGPETKRKVEAARQTWVQAQAEYARAAGDSDANLAAIDARRVAQEQAAAAKRAAIAAKEAEIKKAEDEVDWAMVNNAAAGASPEFKSLELLNAQDKLKRLEAELKGLETGKNPEEERAMRGQIAAEQLEELKKKNAFEALDTEGKIAELTARRAALEEKIAAARLAGSTDELNQLLLQQEVLAGSIGELERQDNRATKSAAAPTVDQLQRISLFVGGGRGTSRSQEETYLRGIEQKIAAMDRKLGQRLQVEITG